MTRAILRPLAFAAALLAAGGSAPARACGACIEDRVAATYDHGVIERAMAKRQQVVFVAIDGDVDASAVDRSIGGARVPGVVTGSLRTSASPAAFSFALAASHAPARAVADYRKAVGDPRARLTLIRIVRDGRLLDPAEAAGAAPAYVR